MIRLELASNWQFPRGSAGRSYLIRLPLDEDGAIDSATLESQPVRATVRRYWPNQADMVGHLVHTGPGYAIRYEMNGSKLNGTHVNGRFDQRLFELDVDSIRVGELISLTEPDGHVARFRVADIQ